MDKKVCMFVWNHFTNDARVLRECTALSEEGFSVDLICIHDPSDKNNLMYEKLNERFHVYRVQRYPSWLELSKRFLALCKQNIWILIATALIWCLAIFVWPIFTLIFTFLFLGVFKLKFGPVLVKANIFLRMVIRGCSKRYDIYHSNDLNTLPQGYICAKVRFKKKKLVYDSHEVQTSRTGYDNPIYGKLESFLLKKIDTMIVENDTRAKYNQELYGFYPNVIHNYPFKKDERDASVAPLHNMLNLPSNEKLLLYQGGIQTGRGLDKLIQAAPLFKEGTLVLIGDGKIKKDLIKMVEELKLSEKVKFIPKVPLAELPKYTRNAYIGFQVLNNVCFNHYSASSNKLFEYMMSGVPVVACNFPEIKKVVEGEKVGICIDSHNYQEIAEAVNTLLDDEQLRDRFSANCLRAKNKYNWEEEKEHFLQIYKKIS
ncbi:glycosyltransferase [Cytobacillus firmus]|uniref:glycosyltransferase n=1 Tax=Cytobacillus firmus TaxID=1399 RepID=UPI001CFD9408|nr:glycosyltransferase [Cytobacillus firmus]